MTVCAFLFYDVVVYFWRTLHTNVSAATNTGLVRAYVLLCSVWAKRASAWQSALASLDRCADGRHVRDLKRQGFGVLPSNIASSFLVSFHPLLQFYAQYFGRMKTIRTDGGYFHCEIYTSVIILRTSVGEILQVREGEFTSNFMLHILWLHAESEKMQTKTLKANTKTFVTRHRGAINQA